MRYLALLLTFAAAIPAADDYTGPRPPEADVLYLLHASNLVPTEATQAKRESKKNSDTYWVEGTSSPARTPLAEPIFLIRGVKIKPDDLGLYRFEVKNGRRELTLSQRRGRRDPDILHLSVTKLDKDLYRVEADQPLENGEYSLSPEGSDAVFCFEVY
jgi:hypothetical protein